MVEKEETVFTVCLGWGGGRPLWHRSGFGAAKCLQKPSEDSGQEVLTPECWECSPHTRADSKG